MKNFAKTALVALALAATAAPAMAQQINWTTGIGFGNSRVEAQQASVRAWVRQAMVDHGDGNWNTAVKGPMECYQEQQNSGGYTTNGIGIGGDINGNWSCTVTGVPYSVVNG